MKFVLRILIYLVATLANLALYVLLFMAAAGMSPQKSMNVLKTKIEEAAVDTLAAGSKPEKLASDVKDEIEQAREKASAEMKDLQNQKAALDSEKADLEKLRDEVQRLLARKNRAEEDKMYNLAKIYDSMDQEKLASVFANMNDSLIVKILPKMKSNNASLVLEYLPPQRSAMISRMLLGSS
jgi:flagellar motility protein MotE (MotC chaperone)